MNKHRVFWFKEEPNYDFVQLVIPLYSILAFPRHPSSPS